MKHTELQNKVCVFVCVARIFITEDKLQHFKHQILKLKIV